MEKVINKSGLVSQEAVKIGQNLDPEEELMLGSNRLDGSAPCALWRSEMDCGKGRLLKFPTPENRV